MLRLPPAVGVTPQAATRANSHAALLSRGFVLLMLLPLLLVLLVVVVLLLLLLLLCCCIL